MAEVRVRARVKMRARVKVSASRSRLWRVRARPRCRSAALAPTVGPGHGTLRLRQSLRRALHYDGRYVTATPSAAGEHRGVIELAERAQPIVGALQPERHLVRLRLRVSVRLS